MGTDHLKLIWVKEEIYISGNKLEDIISEFKQCIERYGSTARLIYESDEYESFIQFYVEYQQYETEKEYEERIREEAVRSQYNKIRELRQLKELKEKYPEV